MHVLLPNGNVAFKCYKCMQIKCDCKLIQIDGFKDPSMFHAVRLCPECVNYLKNHKFRMSEDF